MIARWASGESSHPNAAELAQIYPPDENGESIARLENDIWNLQEDPMVQEAEQRLRAAMYTADDEPLGGEGAPEEAGGGEGFMPGEAVHAFWPDETQEGGGTWMAAHVHEVGEDGNVTITWDEDGSGSQLPPDYLRKA